MSAVNKHALPLLGKAWQYLQLFCYYHTYRGKVKVYIYTRMATCNNESNEIDRVQLLKKSKFYITSTKFVYIYKAQGPRIWAQNDFFDQTKYNLDMFRM